MGTGASATSGRHALHDGRQAVRIADLLARAARRTGQPQPAGRDGTPTVGSYDSAASAADNQRDWLVSELVDARIEAENVRRRLDAAMRELVALREVTDAELASQRAAHEDRQTWWELRVLELEKDVAELTDELDERSGGADGAMSVSAVAGELERLRVELEQARAEASDAAAEADAAFTELKAAYAALSAAQSQSARRPRGGGRR